MSIWSKYNVKDLFINNICFTLFKSELVLCISPADDIQITHIILAVGNDGPGTMRAPAYFLESMSVGAIDAAFQPAPVSGGGLSPITQQSEPDIAGFGVNILSSLERDVRNRSVYAHMSGTSMAAPYVTGIAALHAAANPQLRGTELRRYLTDRALPLESPADRVGVGLARFT